MYVCMQITGNRKFGTVCMYVRMYCMSVHMCLMKSYIVFDGVVSLCFVTVNHYSTHIERCACIE